MFLKSLDDESLLPRNQRKDNPVLIKPQVGQVKQTIFKLPTNQHVYGKMPKHDKEGAGQVLGRWEFPQQSNLTEQKQDFKKLNKMAIKQGLHNSSGLYTFRKQHDVKTQVKQGQKGYSLQIPDENFVYGRVSKPSTPMNCVMQNRYGQESTNQMLSFYQHKQQRQRQLSDHRKQQYSSVTSSYSNIKAGGCYVKKSNINEEKLKIISEFKLKKFENVSPRVNQIWQNSSNTSRKSQQSSKKSLSLPPATKK